MRCEDGRIGCGWSPSAGLFLIAILATAFPAGASPAANDVCALALPIAADGTVFGSTDGFTVDGVSRCGASLLSPDVWFQVDAAADGWLVADATAAPGAAADYAPVLSVFSACPGSLAAEITCAEDERGDGAEVVFPVVAGESYWLRVAGFAGGSGAFRLDVSPGGTIAGRVTAAAGGAPLGDVRIVVGAIGAPLRETVTAADGRYVVSGLLPAGYRVVTRQDLGFVDLLHDGVPCLDGFCDFDAGTPVPVIDRETATVDFALPRGGSIAGVVRDEHGAPIPDIEVHAVLDGRFALDRADQTDADGRYRLDGLPAGDYFVSAEDRGRFYLDEVFDDLPCGAFCNPPAGTPVAVALGQERDVDFVLARSPGGGIRGTVTSESGAPLEHVAVSIWSPDGGFAGEAFTGPSGAYRIGGLVSAEWLAIADGAPGFVGELYDDVPCAELPDDSGFPSPPPPPCDLALGDPIVVSGDAVADGVDFALARGGEIAGRVTRAADGEPVFGVWIIVTDEAGRLFGRIGADADGRWRVGGLPADRRYFVFTDSAGRFVDQAFDGVPCPADAPCDPAAGVPAGAAPIAVEAGAVTGGVDFALARIGAVAGRVVDAVHGTPLWRAEVELWRADAVVGIQRAGSARADEEGRYVVEGLEAGTYFATAEADRYLPERFDDQRCPRHGGRECSPLSGTPIAVATGGLTGGVDFGLDPGSVVTGRVVAASTGEPAGGRVEIWNRGGQIVATADVDPRGRYAAEGLAPGTYFATTRTGDARLGDELYDGVPCPGGAPDGCDPTAGTPIVVGGREARTGVDFALGGPGDPPPVCVVDDHALCLAGGRFRVEARWATADAQGRATALPLTGDTGAFYFFREENLELMVKVLDACLRHDRFWVFAAGLTNVEVRLTVTDTQTGSIREYVHARGKPFVPIQDTRAFATCP